VHACRLSTCDESFLVRSRGIVVRDMPKRSLMVLRRLVVTSEWQSRLRVFSWATWYMFSFGLCFSWVVGVGGW
jgi:hypothetical protein